MSNRSSLYSVEDGKLVRKNAHCKICGPGVFLANHSNRSTCGRCGYDASPSIEPVATESTEQAPTEATSEEE